jgi:DNA-binding NarL/FixJ family response regulator
MARQNRVNATYLTDREKQILNFVWSGLKNREIGARLKISAKTVKAHRANMMKKLRASNAVQLLKAANEEGFIKIRRT